MIKTNNNTFNIYPSMGEQEEEVQCMGKKDITTSLKKRPNKTLNPNGQFPVSNTPCFQTSAITLGSSVIS